MMKLIILSLLTTSCASYVQSLHQKIDQEERVKRMRQTRQHQRYQQNRNARYNRNGMRNPVTLSNVNTASHSNYAPSQNFNYPQIQKRRVKVNDLKDNADDGSLWSGKNSENFLFVTNNLKKVGDIVIVEVMKDFKDQIQDELKRRFPDPPKKKSKKKKDKDEKKEEAKEETVADTGSNNPDKVYDKISTSVVERINQDYLLIRGKKEVLFKKVKRVIEVQTVVSQKDINSKDIITSPKLLEPKVNIIR